MNWHGWSRKGSDTTLHIGPVPGRKRIQLYTIKGTVLITHASFTTEDDAQEVMWVIDDLLVQREAGVLE